MRANFYVSMLRGIKTLNCLVLIRTFQKRPHNISGSKKIAWPRFHAVFLVCKIKKRTHRSRYF